MAATNDNQNEADIRRTIGKFLEAVRRKDLDATMACYANDTVVYDMMPPLRYQGVAGFRKAWEMGFSMSEGPFVIEPRDLSITAGNEVGFAHALNHVVTTAKDGTKVDMWLRWTGCFRKIDGTWKVAHEQTSVPIDMTSQTGMFDLKP